MLAIINAKKGGHSLILALALVRMRVREAIPALEARERNEKTDKWRRYYASAIRALREDLPWSG